MPKAKSSKKTGQNMRNILKLRQTMKNVLEKHNYSFYDLKKSVGFSIPIPMEQGNYAMLSITCKEGGVYSRISNFGTLTKEDPDFAEKMTNICHANLLINFAKIYVDKRDGEVGIAMEVSVGNGEISEYTAFRAIMAPIVVAKSLGNKFELIEPKGQKET